LPLIKALPLTLQDFAFFKGNKKTKAMPFCLCKGNIKGKGKSLQRQ
jgi:hypothetical protein